MMQTLLSLVKDMDIYMSQHAIYISKLEKAIENREPFQHKTCKECNFGKKFYEEIFPHIEDYPEDIKSILLDIEKLHCEFHEMASKINTQNPSPEDKELIKNIESESAKLFQKLLVLKKKVLSGE